MCLKVLNKVRLVKILVGNRVIVAVGDACCGRCLQFYVLI